MARSQGRICPDGVRDPGANHADRIQRTDTGRHAVSARGRHQKFIKKHKFIKKDLFLAFIIFIDELSMIKRLSFRGETEPFGFALEAGTTEKNGVKA